MDNLKISFDFVWKIGGIVVLLSIMYAKVGYLEKDNADLREQLNVVRADQKWTERTLLQVMGTE